MTDHHVYIESLSKLADLASGTMSGGAARTNSSKISGCSFAEALRLARHGWPEGAEKVKQFLGKLDLPAIQDVHSITQHDVTGAYVDVGEYVQGTPECMVDFKQDTRQVRFARVIVSAGFRADVTIEQAMARGVVVAAVIDALEARGIRCDVEMVRTCVPHGHMKEPVSYIHLPLKSATDPLDLGKLAFAVAHPAYHRRLMFAVMECQTKEYRTMFGVPHGGYGYSITSTSADPDAIIFPSPEPGEAWDETTAKAWVTKVLEGRIESVQGVNR